MKPTMGRCGTFSRSYKDPADQWQRTQSFGLGDLLMLAKMVDQTHSRIFELQRENAPDTPE